MAQIDKLSKKILNYMQTHTANPSETFYDFDEGPDEIAAAVSSDSESVRASVRFLEKHEFVKYAYSGEYPLYFYLDHKGLHSREFHHLEVKERWLERLYGFLSGVAVTVIAGLIIRCIAG